MSYVRNANTADGVSPQSFNLTNKTYGDGNGYGYGDGYGDGYGYGNGYGYGGIL